MKDIHKNTNVQYVIMNNISNDLYTLTFQNKPSEYILNVNPLMRSDILSIGEKFYNDKEFNAVRMHEREIYEKELSVYQEKLEKQIKEIHSKEVEILTMNNNFNSLLKKKIDEVQQKYNESIENEKRIIAQGIHLIRDEMNMMHDIEKKNLCLLHEKEKEMMKMMHENEKKSNNELDQHKNALIDELKKEKNIFFSKMDSTVHKGQVGELMVKSYIENNFYNYEVADTSNRANFGDLYIENNGMKLMIEVKNMEKMDRTAVDKFFNNVTHGVNNGRINAALFISLKDTHLYEGIKDLHFCFIDSVPCVMISNALINTHYIRMSIVLLEKLVNQLRNVLHIDDDVEKCLSLSMQHMYEQYNEDMMCINNEEKSLNNLLISLKQRKERLCETDAFIREYTVKYGMIIKKEKGKHVGKNKIDHIDIQNKLIEWARENKGCIKLENLIKMNIDQNTCNKYGGIMVMRKYVDQCRMNPTDIHKLNLNDESNL